MDNKKDDSYYVLKIKEDCNFIINNMADITLEKFADDEIIQSAMMFKIIQISENGKKLSNEYRNKCDTINWHMVFGLRNKIVHEYGHTDLETVYLSLTEDIPDLARKLK